MTCECYGAGICRACKSEAALPDLARLRARVGELDQENKRLRELLGLPQGCPRCGGVEFKLLTASSQWSDDSVVCINCGYSAEHDIVAEKDQEFQRLKQFCGKRRTIHDLQRRITDLEAALATERERLDSSEGAKRILAERLRQVSREGWTPEHDDEHNLAEMSRAAMAYTRLAASQACCPSENISREPNGWPWHFCWWKPSVDPIRNLEKAGALIAAEIDRLLRIDAARRPE